MKNSETVILGLVIVISIIFASILAIKTINKDYIQPLTELEKMQSCENGVREIRFDINKKINYIECK